ncbi:MAG: alpha-2 type collagen [Pseudomonas sp.]|nr:alpha-2 type collagen [Pseudomonas sp.]
MNTSVPSVDQLKELALPSPVSYVPQTWGWAALLAIILLAVALWAARRYWQWRQDRYRREALARLDQLEHALSDDNGQIPALRELPELLKRVALSMPNQPLVATLSGDDWQQFLASRSRDALPADFSQQLARLAYGPEAQLRALSTAQRQQLLNQCKHWVEHHHVAA